MLNKSSLILTTVGFLSFTAVQAHHISACDFESAEGTCSGYFYPDINTAFVDCKNEDGHLVSRKEAFFTKPLQKECAPVVSLPVEPVDPVMPANETSGLNDTVEGVNETMEGDNTTMSADETPVPVDSEDNSTSINATEPVVEMPPV